ncbi:hypothetical protein [Streptomyces sp. AD55]|uniref:DUF7224 domain-containing protein n=1 Tax=Streptomyces sp. AD55 TaxID=3242895 RepID=UPI0035291699
MRFLTALRASSAKWAALLLLPATWFLVIEWARFAERGFGTAVAEAAAFPVFAVAAVCSACAAWEAGRLRRSQVWGLAPVRGRLRIATDAMVPVLVLAVAALAVGLLAASVDLGTPPDSAGMLPLASGALVALSYAVLGFGVGSVTPRVVGAPLMLVGVYVWMTVPASSNVMWVRHLSGMQITSSTVTDSVAPTAFAAPVLLSASAAAGLMLLVSGAGGRGLRAVPAVCCAVAGSLTAYLLVADWGPDAPTTPRTGATVCARSGPRICVPREYAADIPRVHRTATDVLARLETVGLRRPLTLALVSGDAAVSPTTWRFDPHPDQDDTALRSVIAWSAMPDVPDCFAHDDGYTGSDEEIRAWLLLVSGIGEEQVSSAMDATRVHVAAKALDLPPAAQVDWFRATVTALRSCAPTPEPASRAS